MMMLPSSGVAGGGAHCFSCLQLASSAPCLRNYMGSSSRSRSRSISSDSGRMMRNNNRRRLIHRHNAILESTAASVDLAATASTSTPAAVDISWQIFVGSLAGIIPFVVAGIEFSKRIIAQRNCEICGGSGLLLKGDVYIRCPNCGGFLPWQSWKRFFTG